MRSSTCLLKTIKHGYLWNLDFLVGQIHAYTIYRGLMGQYIQLDTFWESWDNFESGNWSVEIS